MKKIKNMLLRLTLSISFIVILSILYARTNKSTTINMENTWTVSTYYENKLPVIIKHIQSIPDKNTIKRLPYLTVISWAYDGSHNNGMAKKEINDRMIILEEAILHAMKNTSIFTPVYVRTGNNLKEFVYYCTNQSEFMKLLNDILKKHTKYPIQVNFYEDREWIDLKKVLSSFSK